MDPLEWCVLLALLLLKAATSVDEAEYGRRDDHCCKVIGISDNEVSLACGGDVQEEIDEKTLNSAVTAEPYMDSTVTLTSEVKNDSITSVLQEINTINNTLESKFNEGSGNSSHSVGSHLNLSLYDIKTNIWSTPSSEMGKEVNNSHTKESSTNITAGNKWYNITIVKVTFMKHISTLNLYCYPNARTVILNTFGHNLLNIYGAQNITNLRSSASKLTDVSFVRFFKYVNKVNFSDNNIKSIPITDIPPFAVNLDLSFNEIGLLGNESFPDNLQVLNISFNKIVGVNVTLKGNLRVLDIRKNRLVHIPILQLGKLEELFLSGNNISKLEEGAFKYLISLTVLDLRGNKLTNLEERVFLGLSKLQWLDMSDNKVVSLAPAAFQYLNNLVSLSLSGNTNLGNLQDIDDASFLFGTGQRLQTIEASRTNLTRIPSTLTRTVRKLFLANNKIKSIQCGELDSFPLIKIMDISNNVIFDVEEDALGRLDFLSHLILSGNKINSVPKSLPDQLQIFDLRCNLIEILKTVDFIGLQKLRVLLLSRNKISVIEDGAFGQLTSLEVLDLSHNPIKSLSRTSFIGPRKLKEIYLRSLTDLIPLEEPLSFPAPESAHLEILNMEYSPVLATQLMDDVAALTMFHELFELNLNHCRLSTLRSDLPKYLPRLHKLEITGNVLNCTNIIWLVKWLQELNISMQDSGKFRREIYNLKDICCAEVNNAKRYDEGSGVCASPDYLSGKQIISLREEDFPDFKLTSSTLPEIKQVVTTEAYLPQTITYLPNDLTSTSLNMTDNFSETSILINNETTSTDLLSYKTTAYSILEFEDSNKKGNETEFRSKELRTVKHLPNSKSSQSNTSRSMKSEMSMSRVSQKWKYLKSETNYGLPSIDPVIVLLNSTKTIINDLDNQLNDSISSGAFLAHEIPAASHPGMVVFLLVVGVIVLAASAMIYSHYYHSRRGRDYHHHQDIEVSSLGGTDLW